MLASEAWYASGIFWGALTTVVTLAAAVIALIAWRIGPPRRLLTYRIPIATSLLSSNAPGGLARDELRVIYRGTELADPYIVSFHIENQSRSDISSKDFDEKDPLVFDIGASIVGLVGGGQSVDLSAKELKIENNEIKLGPTLITQRQVITFDLLINGPPHLKCKSPLIDVTVREESPEDLRVRKLRKSISKAAIVVFIAGILFALLAFIPITMPNYLADVFGWIAVILLFIGLIAIASILADAATIAQSVARRRLRKLRHRESSEI